jgi:hypothetical protein
MGGRVGVGVGVCMREWGWWWDGGREGEGGLVCVLLYM